VRRLLRTAAQLPDEPVSELDRCTSGAVDVVGMGIGITVGVLVAANDGGAKASTATSAAPAAAARCRRMVFLPETG
jgi:hypothetical protein